MAYDDEALASHALVTDLGRPAYLVGSFDRLVDAVDAALPAWPGTLGSEQRQG